MDTLEITDINIKSIDKKSIGIITYILITLSVLARLCPFALLACFLLVSFINDMYSWNMLYLSLGSLASLTVVAYWHTAKNSNLDFVFTFTLVIALIDLGLALYFFQAIVRSDYHQSITLAIIPLLYIVFQLIIAYRIANTIDSKS